MHVAIEALDGACADCLVGPDLLTHFMVRELKKSRDAAALPSVRVSMPSTTSHSWSTSPPPGRKGTPMDTTAKPPAFVVIYDFVCPYSFIAQHDSPQRQRTARPGRIPDHGANFRAEHPSGCQDAQTSTPGERRSSPRVPIRRALLHRRGNHRSTATSASFPAGGGAVIKSAVGRVHR